MLTRTAIQLYDGEVGRLKGLGYITAVEELKRTQKAKKGH